MSRYSHARRLDRRSDPESLAALGIETARQGDSLAALRLLHRSIESDRDCYQAWLGLYETFRAIDEPRRAAHALRIARRLRALGPRAARERGDLGNVSA